MDNKPKYTIQKDIENVKDLLYSNRHVPLTNLPVKVNLAPKCSPIVDQGQLGSCTANAIVSGLREYILINDEKKSLVRLSRLFIYWWERNIEGTVNEDSGASLRDGMKVLCKYGVCTESTDPYDISKFTEKPSAQEMQEALKYTIVGYQRLSSLSIIKDALYHDHVVAFSMQLYSSFESDAAAKTGIISTPKQGEENIGGHAMCIVGYDDTLNGGSFIVRNSWGSSWGSNGYCFIPYTMISYFMDAWTVMYGKKYLSDYLHGPCDFVGYIRNKLNFKK